MDGLYGPVEGRRRDSSMLASSSLLQELQRFSNSPIAGIPMCLYGDPAYPLCAHIQGPFRGAALTQDQYTAMNGARKAFEWVFGDIIIYFKFLDFKKRTS